MSTTAPTPAPAPTPVPTDLLGLLRYCVLHPLAALSLAAAAFALATACQLGWHPLGMEHPTSAQASLVSPCLCSPAPTSVPVRFDPPGLTRSAER